MSTMRKTETTPLSRLVAAASVVVMLGLAPVAQADETVALKHALYGAGYDITNVSPQMDDGTRAALTQFQKDNGLQATGILNEETKKALGMIPVQVAANSGSAASTPAAPAADTAKPATEAEQAPAKAKGAVEEDEDGGWSLW